MLLDNLSLNLKNLYKYIEKERDSLEFTDPSRGVLTNALAYLLIENNQSSKEETNA